MYYFAYGSNMNYEHMRRLCGWHFSVLGVASLADYEFGPDNRGYANIRPQKNSQVVGVLYDVDQHALDVLDDFEGYPEVFNRLEVDIKLLGDEPENARAWVYAEDAKFFGNGQIKEEYLRRVIAGATENRLPEEWVAFLKSFQKTGNV